MGRTGTFPWAAPLSPTCQSPDFLLRGKKISQLKVIICYMQPNAILSDAFGKLLQIFVKLRSSRVSGNSEMRIDQLCHKQNMERASQKTKGELCLVMGDSLGTFWNPFFTHYRIIYHSPCCLHPKIRIPAWRLLLAFFLLFQNEPSKLTQSSSWARPGHSCPSPHTFAVCPLFRKSFFVLSKADQCGYFYFSFSTIIHICATTPGIELAKTKSSLARKGRRKPLALPCVIF